MCGKAKCTVSRTQPLPWWRQGGIEVPGLAQGPARHRPAARTESVPGSVQLAPVSGPVCRKIRLSFGSMWRREGRGQDKAYQDGRDGSGGTWVPANATVAGLEPPCPNRGLTKAGKGNREGAGG